MPATARNQSRKQQTQAELARVLAAVKEWLARQRSLDRDDDNKYVGRHKTQLETVESLLTEAIGGLRQHVDASDPGADAGVFYAQIRAYDEAIVGLERVWQFFRDKFDQRDPGRRERSLLRAADEVVWSCYRQVFGRPVRDAAVRQGAAPLCYVAAEYSPAAMQFDRPPSSLMLGADLDFLEGFMRTLPVPLLRLPPWAVDAPWWLVYVAHEVGHHVQKDLGLINWFASGIRAAAAKAGALEASELDKWSRWGEEIFADVFSIMMMGPWAVFGVLEAEWNPPDQMVKRKREYPSPVIRLALMHRVAQKLSEGLRETWFDPLQEIDLQGIADGDPIAERDWQVVEAVSEFCLGPMRDNLGTLQQLCGLKAGIFSQPGVVSRWSGSISRPDAVIDAQDLDTARQLTSAALQSWVTLTANGPVYVAGRTALAGRTTDCVVRSAMPGTRGPLMPPGAVPGKGGELLDRLLRNTEEARAALHEE